MYSRSLAFLLVASGTLALVSALTSSQISLRCRFFSARSSCFFFSFSFCSALSLRLDAVRLRREAIRLLREAARFRREAVGAKPMGV